MILLLGGSDACIFVEILVRILSDFHDRVEDFVATGLDSHLDLLLQLLYLRERVVEFHLQIVSLKDNGLEMHLLTPDYMLF